jgi:hypothetical protein
LVRRARFLNTAAPRKYGANQKKRPIQILVYWRADPPWELARLIDQGFVVTGATTLMKKLLAIELTISSVTNY